MPTPAKKQPFNLHKPTLAEAKVIDNTPAATAEKEPKYICGSIYLTREQIERVNTHCAKNPAGMSKQVFLRQAVLDALDKAGV